MLISIFLLALQGFSGGVSGYITNKYAVNMLFKEYTPLKLGGVIKKKREKFIEEISELVERDIINADTLRPEISNKRFNIYIEKIADVFFEKELKESLGNTKIFEITDFSNTVAKSEGFIRNNLNMILPELLENFLTNSNLKDLLGEEQVSKIVNKGYEILVSELENTNLLDEFINNIYKENSNITLAQILSEEIQKNLVNNISECMSRIIKHDVLANEESCRIFLDNVCVALDIDLILNKLQGLIGDYEINKFITASEEDEFILKLFSKINDFINSQKGKELILNLVNEIVLIGKDIDFTIYEMLPTEMEKSLTHFIKAVVPKVMPYISEWISNNKVVFDEMIESAIDEAIEDIDVNIKKLIISKVRNALMGDISSKNNIVSKIISYMNNSLDEEAYINLASSLINYLKNSKVKDMVALLEKQDLFSSEEIMKVINKQFELHGKSILGAIVKHEFSKKIRDIIKLDFVKLFHTKLKPLLYENIFKNKEELGDKLNSVAQDFINAKSGELFNKKISEIFNYNNVSSFSNKFAKLTSKLLEKNKTICTEKLKDILVSKVKNINIAYVIENYKMDISEFIVDNSIGFYKEVVDKYKELEVKDIITAYLNKKQLSHILINEGYPMLISKLPNLLNGNIKKFAKNNLSKYNEDEICDIVQEFMGNQLKPLSVFGAVLGTIVGVIYQLIFQNAIGRYGFPSNAFDVIMSCGIMAFIGYITNVVALWMIFHPYKENKIVAKIPFFKKFALGYIPAHKNQFAVGMAKLIDEELLNKEEINKSFNSHKNKGKSLLIALATNNNYQIIVDFARNKKKDLARNAYKKILKYFSINANLSKGISRKIGDKQLNSFIKKDNVLNISSKLLGSINNTENYLAAIVQDKLSANYKLNDTLPEAVCNEVKKYIKDSSNKLIEEKVVSTRNKDIIRPIVDNYSGHYNSIIQKTVKEILDNDLSEKIKNNIKEKAYTYVFNDFKIYCNDLLNQFLHNELNENNNIGSMFKGNIKAIIDKNLNSLVTYASNKLVAYLKDNEYVIALDVQETIKGELNFFEKIAYATFGGDDIANKVASIILHEKLPEMLKNEKERIISSAEITLNECIYPIKVNDLKIDSREINTTMLIDNLFDKLGESISFKEHIYKASDLILDSLISAPLTEYLELCNLGDLNLVYNRFNKEIITIEEEIYNNIDLNKDTLFKMIGEFLDENIILPLFNSHNSEIFKNNTLEEIRDTIKNILGVITSSGETKEHISIFLSSFYNSTLSKLKIEQITDEKILNRDVEKIIRCAFEDIEFNEKNLILLEKVIENAIEADFDFISDDTKDYLIDKAIRTGLNSINHYVVPVLQEIDLKNISNKQIDLLNPREIDILFNSFAGDFFKKLRLYGVFGFVFGINVGLSIILWAIDLRYSKDYSNH
ncbi:DUF445 family protein [Clostridium sp.]|uniref:DUF445 family protein n=1 Tax=Clostridium sp. TaxID=1506 RepID=UPI002608A896|nr:DUF445 family protein [Clostridium sp.]